MLEKKIVLVFDICSSTNILEDLHKTENMQSWSMLLRYLNSYIRLKAPIYSYIPYKFLGDGWILLFNYSCSGKRLITFMENLSLKVSSFLDSKILKLLDIPPEINGLTFGLDRGTLFRVVMNNRAEYIGRALNVACRLQGAIKDNDSEPQYKILMTNHLYNHLKNDLVSYKCYRAKRKLRNIAGDQSIRCMKIALKLLDNNKKTVFKKYRIKKK